MTDAELYASGKREDDYLFVLIYGLSHKKVQQLALHKNHTAIRALIDYGTMEADSEIRIPDLVKTAFIRFCYQLCDSPSKSLYYYDQGDPYRSHWNFTLKFQQCKHDRRAAERTARRERDQKLSLDSS